MVAAAIGGLFTVLAVLGVDSPGLGSVKTNAALGLTAAGALVWALGEGDGSSARRRALAASLAALAIGGLTVVEYILDWNLGIDELFAFDADPGAGMPGRMAPSTAACLLALGVAGLCWLRGGRAVVVARVLAVTVAFIATVAVAGYLYGVEPVFGLSSSSAMALPTAVALDLCGVGLFAVITAARLERDDTARGALIEALRASEEQFRLLVDGVRDYALVRLDPTGRIESWNPGAERITGHRADEIIGRHFSCFYSEADIAAGHPQMQLAIATEVGHYAEEGWRIRRDGGRFWGDVAIRQIRGPEGGLRGFSMVTCDATERRTVEEALLAARADLEQRVRERTAALEGRNAELRSVLDSASDGIITADASGRIVGWNHGAETIFGWTAGEAIGQAIDLIVPEHLLPRHHGAMSRAAVPGTQLASRPAPLSVDGKRRDGSLFPAEISVGRWQGAEGLYFCGIVRDVTERRASEQELVRAKEAAESAMRGRSEFLARMSHEIRTPLNGVLGMAELALQTDLDAEPREYIETARSSAGSLLSVINDILDFSKIDAGKMRLEFVPFGLRAALSTALAGLAERAHAKQLELVLRVRPDVPDRVIGDPHRLVQIVVNLVGNAIKFTDIGEVTVDVTLAARGALDVTLAVAIADTGIGIPQHRQALVFEAFAQQDSSISRRFGGTGLGLSIASQLAQLMDGEISVTSELGRGSRFVFTAKLGLDHGAVDDAVDAGPLVRGATVLIADDHAATRLMLEEMMLSWHMCPVGSGLDGAEAALDRIQAEGREVSLILLDVPGSGHGLAVARALQRRTGPRVPFALLTRTARPLDAAWEGALGPIARIGKPVAASALLEIVQALLAGRRPARDASSRPKLHAARPLRVLLAEDNPVNRRLAVALLEKVGHSVIAVDDGRQALSALSRDRFDIVLLDVQMPVLDGIATAQAIRAGERDGRAHLPVLALTAQTMSGDRERCLAAGMDGHIAKPFQLTELLSAMDAAVPAAPPPAVALALPEQGRASALCYDRTELLRRLCGDVELAREMIGLFFEHRGPVMAALVDAVEQGDARATQSAAHRLKGSLASLAAGPASELASRLEQCGRRNDLGAAPELVASLAGEIARLDTALTAELEGAA